MVHNDFQRGGGRERTVPKGHVLQRPGDVVSRGYLVVTGCLRSYVIDANGKEHVLQFAPENWVVGDMKAATRKVTGTMFIDALEDSEVLEVEFGLFDAPAELRPEFMIDTLSKLRLNIVALNERIVDLMAATGEERYLRFVDTYPGLVQRLPQKLIASYLGLTPESLSRIRRSIAKDGPTKRSGVH